MVRATISSSFSIFGCREYNQSDFGIAHLVISMCRVTSCVFVMTSLFSWENSISLCPALFWIPRPNFPIVPFISWLPTLAFQSPRMRRTSVLEGVVSFHSIGQFQPLQHWWLLHKHGLLWCWKVCLGFILKSFYHFWDCIPVQLFPLFCWLWGLLYFFYGILAHSIRYDNCLNWSRPFFRISVFILAISCLTTSSLPRFIDLTFQVSI